MKLFNMLSLTKTTVLLFFLFASFQSNAYRRNKKFVGNGNVITKTVKTGDYDKIKLIGSFDLKLVKGTEGDIRVEAEDNLQEIVKIETEGNTLVIRTKDNVSFSTKKGFLITVPFEEISEINITGSGDVETKDVIRATDFDASITGSGDLDLKIEATSLQTKITGSGDVDVSGTTDKLYLRISGSGNFEGYKLNSENTEISIAGSGNAEVVANRELDVKISGSGDVSYKGRPDKLNLKTSGSGEVSSEN